MEERIRKIVVAVDCGTTHSGVAWKHPESENNVHFVDKWPGGTPTDMPTRVPTRIAYHDDNPSLDKDKAWGYEVGSGHVAASWTKLLLEPGVENKIILHSDNDGWVNSVGIFARPGGRDPSRIVQDFLELLRKHAEAQIKKRCTDLHHAILPFAYVFTVPATWSETAITALKQAASRAGCHGVDGEEDPLIVSEPEAALTTMIGDPTIGIRAGDGVVICDCGGGTLDIGVYLVHKKAIGAYTTVRTHTDFQGGSTEIDRRFYAVVSKDHIKGFGELRCYETSPTSILMRSFEKAKRRFQGTVDASLQNLAYRRRGNKCSFQFTSVDMLRLQSPVITKICFVLENNISQGHRDSGGPIVKHIYLSGAMARSIYLRSAIERLFAKSQIEIHHPRFSQNVVAGGAALWAYNRLRLVELLHHHYGIETPAPPDGAMELDGNDPPVTWVLRRNMPYPLGEPIGASQSTVFPCRVSQDFPFSVIKIYDSDQDVLPETANPEDGVRNIGRLFCDFRKALATSKVKVGEIVQIDVRFIVENSRIHVKAESPGALFGETKVECFY
ncbi:actin-like ATPase domain-containing protein [Aspergillus niger ATCC 13496]|uniref:Actin-like ATPase domain-containing protein n=1 Tax=Aspergillus niger ATCC 13496 TaxID=1353008 RepID=A0A370C210_ASPNG|nr:hypothetical protein ANI_1_2246104 [Aspergillus niger CBS 513.88]RDH21947.1 actin-like ATPase domain-containing protein [Aspergillus niger ATCC 13496]|eukprot:XP_001396025.2 hypothetical protein ANI_1_2246104 [Aspergillus niger CBS 513.88]